MNILLAITGSVAARLAPKLIEGFSVIGDVKMMATKSAEYFIPEGTEYFKEEDEWKWRKKGDSILHIDLRTWADVIVVAPLTANTLAKISAGMADSLVTNTIRAWDYNKSMYLCPVMNPSMYLNPFTKRQLSIMSDLGAQIIKPIKKEMMCGEFGIGALPQVMDIVQKVAESEETKDYLIEAHATIQNLYYI